MKKWKILIKSSEQEVLSMGDTNDPIGINQGEKLLSN